MSNLQPIGDKVAIRPDPAPEKFGTLLMPDTVKDAKPRFGVVLAVGPGKFVCEQMADGEWVHARLPVTCKPGDRVAYSYYGTDGIELDGEEILVITEDRVLGIVAE